MRASVLFASALVLAGFALPARAQGDPAPGAPAAPAANGKPVGGRQLSPEERAARARRWESLPPDQRARLRQLYEGHLRGRSPEELEHLRDTLSQTLPREREATAERKHEFDGRNRDDKLAYQRLMRRLLHAMPDADRRRLAEMEPEERRRAVTQMVEQFRAKLVQDRVRRLPGRVQAPLAEELATLPPRKRLERVRQAIDAHVLERARLIRNDGSLTAEERGKRLNELLQRFGQDEPARERERLRRRIAGREDDGGAPPSDGNRPGDRQPGNRLGPGVDGAGPGRRLLGPRRPRR